MQLEKVITPAVDLPLTLLQNTPSTVGIILNNSDERDDCSDGHLAERARPCRAGTPVCAPGWMAVDVDGSWRAAGGIACMFTSKEDAGVASLPRTLPCTMYVGKGFAKVDTREQNRPHLAVIISLFSHGLKLFLDQVLLANRRRLRRYHGCHITLRSRNYNKQRTPATTRDTEALRSLIGMQSPLPASQWRNKHGQARYRLSHGSGFPSGQPLSGVRFVLGARHPGRCDMPPWVA